ncbi:uncharacterized protein DSM5745_10672 [Aspergillus mulundensis]|uniref:Uncharacterized protein n=1 Tax=Aspergillus mulundensis TaxID=1810919 RepID=A0A3D8QID3_9EURO|nr:hypothetical protein DSM5745_10672 [Aspergillus mulundensis]RDW61174.1 hypothetical protein DSM5745_10672 [Aspergillus mulundensis]
MARNSLVRKPSHDSDDVYTSTVDEEVERDPPAYSSPIRTIKHNPNDNPKNNLDRNPTRNASLESSLQAMQTYSTRQVSTTRNGAGEIQSQHEVLNTGQFRQNKQSTSNDGLKLKLDLNLDVEVELKARIHGDLTLALLK